MSAQIQVRPTSASAKPTARLGEESASAEATARLQLVEIGQDIVALRVLTGDRDGRGIRSDRAGLEDGGSRALSDGIDDGRPGTDRRL